MRSAIRSLPLAALAAVGLLFAASCTPRAQATTESFAAERFAELQAEGALVLVDVAAPWCGTCVIQGNILAAYQAEKPDVPLLILRVDYDTQKDVLAALRAPPQSTLILFRGEQELWRSVGEIDRETIVAALDGGVASL